MTDVDQNNRRAQRWKPLDTKGLDDAAAGANVSPKQRELFDALTSVVREGVKDLYGDAADYKYLYIVNLIMQRVRAALSEKLEESSSQDIEDMQAVLDAKLAKQNSEQYDNLSQTFVETVKNAFSDIPVRIDGDDKDQILDSVREYTKTAVEAVREEDSEKLDSKFDDIKKNLTDQFKKKSDSKGGFNGKTQRFIKTQLQTLQTNQRRLQFNITGGFKRTSSAIGKSVGRLNNTVKSVTSGISNKISNLKKSISKIDFGGMISSVGHSFINMFSIGPLKLITGPLSLLWKGVSGLTRWAAGGLFSILGKFLKSPAGLIGLVYVIGYIYGRWIKPFWEGTIMPIWRETIKPILSNLKKWISGEETFTEAFGKVWQDAKKKMGFDPNVSVLSQIRDVILNYELVELKGLFGYVTSLVNQLAQHITGLKMANKPNSFTVGTAFTVLGSMIAANIAAQILTYAKGAGIKITPIAIAIGGAKVAQAGWNKVLKWTGLDDNPDTSLANGFHTFASSTKPLKPLTDSTKTLARHGKEVSKLTDKVKNVANNFDKAVEAGKFDEAKKFLDKGIELEKQLEKLGIKGENLRKFLAWLAKHPKLLKAIRVLSAAGKIASIAGVVMELYKAFEEENKGHSDIARVYFGKASVAIIDAAANKNLATSVFSTIITQPTQIGLDYYAKMLEAEYQEKDSFDGMVDSARRLAEVSFEYAKNVNGKMSDDELFMKQIKEYDAVKAKYDKLLKKKQWATLMLQREGKKKLWKFELPSREKAWQYDSDAREAQYQIDALLARFGVQHGFQLEEFKKKRDEYLFKLQQQESEKLSAMSQLKHPQIKLDVETQRVMQAKLSELYEEAKKTKEEDDDHLIQTLQNGFDAGNEKVIQLLMQLIREKQSLTKQANGANTIIMMTPPSGNPAMIESDGALGQLYRVMNFTQSEL